MDKAWPSMKDTEYSIPFIYYTDTSSYVVNPPRKFAADISTFFLQGLLKLYDEKE